MNSDGLINFADFSKLIENQLGKADKVILTIQDILI